MLMVELYGSLGARGREPNLDSTLKGSALAPASHLSQTRDVFLKASQSMLESGARILPINAPTAFGALSADGD
jgi:hypothetical protein